MAESLNDIIRSATHEYLQEIDAANPPDPHTIENELLNRVNTGIALINAGRDKGSRLTTLKTLTFAQIADIMLHLYTIRRIGPSGKNTDPDLDMLALYQPDGPDKGIYLTSEDAFRTIARQYNYSLTTKDFNEVLMAINDAAPRTSRCTDKDLIAVDNGIFNYETKQCMPFSPDVIFLSKSRVKYVENPENPVIFNETDGTFWDVESWMQSLSDDPEIVNLLWEILGAIIRPNVRWNKSAWLFSERGNNGKGTLCELMRELCGPTTYASIPISDFSKDFALEPLVRASAIIVDENDVGAFIDRAANLKAVITNDVISINRKYKKMIAFQFYGFMVQCLNEFPRIKDKSESFYRRQLFVPMTKNFTGRERRYIKNDYLHRPEVLQYVLHRVLHMNYYVLSQPQATVDVLNEYKGFNDPIREFWEEFRDQFVWDLLPFTFLYSLYKSWFVKNSPSGSPVGRNGFISDIKTIVMDDETWAYPNKKMRSKGMVDQIETLIVDYDLKDFYNSTYTGSDPMKKAACDHKQIYDGVVRRSASETMLTSVPMTGTDGGPGVIA